MTSREFGQGCPATGARRSQAQIKIALLRAHGLIRKVSKSHRYLQTAQGLTAAGALLGARNATLDQLATAT